MEFETEMKTRDERAEASVTRVQRGRPAALDASVRKGGSPPPPPAPRRLDRTQPQAQVPRRHHRLLQRGIISRRVSNDRRPLALYLPLPVPLFPFPSLTPLRLPHILSPLRHPHASA